MKKRNGEHRQKSYSSSQKSLIEELVARVLDERNVSALREYKFCHGRQWRFDFAIPEIMVAIEVEGGLYSQRVICNWCNKQVMKYAGGRLVPVYIGGRHLTQAGYIKDRIKYNSAMMNGWSVFSITRGMVSEYIKKSHDHEARSETHFGMIIDYIKNRLVDNGQKNQS